MAKPKVLIFSGYGLNSEEEARYSIELVGGKADIMHLNDIIENKNILQKYQMLIFPGGFAYGDDTGSGNAYANKLRNHLWGELRKFIEKDTLIAGFCNGCQILSQLGLIPAIEHRYGEKQMTLLHNTTSRYVNRWVDLKSCNTSIWTKNITTISAPMAHGEGRVYATDAVLKTMNDKNLIAFRYTVGMMCTYLDLAANPNGSTEDIAGVTDETGRILGLMPHPERGSEFTHLPNWPYLKELLLRQGKKLPTEGPGLQIFKNAVEYFK